MDTLRDKIADALAGAVSQDDRYLEHADAVLRVLAEHGDTQQVEEELVSSGALVLPRGDRINAVMTVVAPLIGYYRSVAEHWLKRAERAEADLAAARMQVRVRDARLDQVRATVKRMHINDGDRDVVTFWVRQLLDVLDAPARPAGHDESGQ
jgi:hypothetical protein